MAKTKMKRTVGRRRKSGKKTSTSTRNKKRKNIIRGGLPIAATIVTALFAAAKLIKTGPADTCKLDGTEPTNLCKPSYSDNEHLVFRKKLNPVEKTELFDAVRNDKKTVEFNGVNWDVFERIDWKNVDNFDELKTEYESGIKQKDKELAASGNTLLDRAVKK